MGMRDRLDWTGAIRLQCGAARRKLLHLALSCGRVSASTAWQAGISAGSHTEAHARASYRPDRVTDHQLLHTAEFRRSGSRSADLTAVFPTFEVRQRRTKVFIIFADKRSGLRFTR